LDPAQGEWEAAWRRIGRELGGSIGDLVASWQIGNELNIWYFRAPLRTIRAAANFVRATGHGLRDELPSSRLGINAFGIDDGAVQLYEALYSSYAELRLDFIGTDCYWGSWQAGGPSDWKATIDLVSKLGGGRPVAVCEIG